MIRIKLPRAKGIFLAIFLIVITPQTFAVESLGTAIDCSNVKVDYTNNPDWTHNERVEAMDKAFFESVNRFELCNLSNSANHSGSSSKGGGQASNDGSAEGNGESKGEGKGEAESEREGEGDGNESRSSSASSTMTGTEKQTEVDENGKSDDYATNESASKEAAKQNAGYQGNGASPKDIPNADNDDVIASQIRVAAEIEKDPVKKKKLWNEYRKYKGLSTQ